MGLFSNKPKKVKPAQAARDAGMKIKFQMVDKGNTYEIDIWKLNDPVSKGIRKIMDNYVAKLLRQHGDLVHPETGERPDVLFFVPKKGSTSVQVRIVTDSPTMRDWLVGKGLAVHGMETSADAKAGELVEEAATNG